MLTIYIWQGLTKSGDDAAVKKLKLGCDVNLDLKQFQNEFYNLTKLKHQNVVQILGYCYETEKKPFIMPDGSKVFVNEIRGALCLEYMHNGSLQQLLHSGTLLPYISVVRVLLYFHLIKNSFCLPLLQMSFLDLNGTNGSK